ncbi:hypothetical protein SAMN05216343_10727 [Oscillibacter sp. PC13]|nr:hypothetical protein SAMN05216343_10727 [Oscillibacter sp. PC13]
MKRIPKTPIEFDYDLWTTEDGKCMVRVKRTGEVTEVDRDVMKALRAEEKRLRRSYTGSNSDDTEEDEVNSSTLSLDALPEDDVKASAWLVDPRDFAEEVTTAMLEQDFLRILTDTQRDIFAKVLREGMKPYDYAKANGVSASSVTQHIQAIRIKAKKYF